MQTAQSRHTRSEGPISPSLLAIKARLEITLGLRLIALLEMKFVLLGTTESFRSQELRELYNT